MFRNNSTLEPVLIKNFSKVNTFITEDGQNNTSQDCRLDDTIVEVIIKSLAYFIILSVSLIGNILIVLIIHKNKQLRKSINYLVFNMALSDLFMPLTITPIQIVKIISGSESWKVDSPWILGNILCKISYFLSDVSFLVSFQSLLLISMDRFIAIVFPLKAKLISPKARFISIGCTWSIATALYSPYFYTFRLFSYGNKTYCWQDWGPTFDHTETHKRYVTAKFALLPVPVCLLAVHYGAMIWTLHKKNTKKTKQQLTCRQARRVQQHKKVIRMSAAIIIAFTVCIMPILVFNFTRIFLWNWEVPPICAFYREIPFIALFMIHSWSAVNPYICFTFNKNYRSGFKQILSCLNCR